VLVPDVFGDEDEQVFTMRRYWILVISSKAMISRSGRI
jgi:hypothetical protein